MIRSFKSKDTENLYNGIVVKKWKSFQKQAEKRLLILDASTSLEDLGGLPSNRLELLKGKLKGKYSIRINDKWRLCFNWINGDPHNVEIVDYH